MRRAASQIAGAVAPSWRNYVPYLIVALFSIGIFYIPYAVPLKFPANSQSWEYNFNNTTAQEFLALMLLALFAWRLYATRQDIDSEPVARTLAGRHLPATRSLWYSVALTYIFTCLGISWWFSVLPYTHYGEFTYFMQRLEIMITTGGMPHRDFDFDYGSGMLFLPYFLYKLFQGRFSAENVYFAVLLLHFGLGYALQGYIISRVNPKHGRSWIFVMLAIPWINLSLGLQYTPLRFLIAPASLFATRHAELAAAGNPRRQWLLLAACALVFPFCGFVISPEMGLATTFALFFYFGWFLLGPHKRLASLIVPLLAGLALTVAILPRAYFNSIFAFGRGGSSFPIFPTIHILLFLGAAILVFPRLGELAIRDRASSGPFCAGLAILLGLLILPATGRCDSGHIQFNSIGLFIIALSAATWMRKGWCISWMTLFSLAFPIMGIMVFWDHYQQPVTQALDARRQLNQMTYVADNYAQRPADSPLPPIHYSKLLPVPDWVTDLPEGRLGIPLGVDENVERYLRLHDKIIPEYHIAPYYDLGSDEDMVRKYDDLKSMKYILAPEQEVQRYLYLQTLNPATIMHAQGQADREWLGGLLLFPRWLSDIVLFPIDIHAVHSLFSADSLLVRHIAGEYGVVKKYPGMLLLERRPQVPLR